MGESANGLLEQDRVKRFIRMHRWATLTVLRQSGAPVSSIVAYALHEDALVVSTPGATFKRHAIEREPRVNLCIMSNEEPFDFVSLEATARVRETELVEPTTRVFDNIASMGYALPEPLDEWLEKESRVILEIKPIRGHAVLRKFENT